MITYKDHQVWADETGTRFRNLDKSRHATVTCGLGPTQDVLTDDGEEVRRYYGFHDAQEALHLAEKFVTTGERPELI